MAAVAILTEEQLQAMLEAAAEKGAQRALAQGEPGVLSTSAAARLADRSEETIRDWIAAGVLPAKKRGRAWAILREDLDRYLAGERGEGGTPSAQALVDSLSRGGSDQPG